MDLFTYSITILFIIPHVALCKTILLMDVLTSFLPSFFLSLLYPLSSSGLVHSVTLSVRSFLCPFHFSFLLHFCPFFFLFYLPFFRCSHVPFSSVQIINFLLIVLIFFYFSYFPCPCLVMDKLSSVVLLTQRFIS